MDSLRWLSPAETHRALTHPLAKQPITCTCIACGLRWQSAPQRGQGRPLECPKCGCQDLTYAKSPLSVIAIAGEAEPVGDGRPLPAPAELAPIIMLPQAEWEARVRAIQAQVGEAAKAARKRQRREWLESAKEWAIIVGIVLAVIVIAGLAGGLD